MPDNSELLPAWDELDRRPLPAWFDQAKLGIFIHWGLYSVPAWAPREKYAEWYWRHLQDREGPTWQFHRAHYGAEFRYQDFAPKFTAGMFEPDRWAECFRRSGARYVVLTSKHHDGFCLWPSSHAWNWNSLDAGPHRDLVGDLSQAVNSAGLKMGLYYSLYEWFNPLYQEDPAAYVAGHMLPQLKDLVHRYEPALLWADGEWGHPSSLWRSREFLHWLYTSSPVRDHVVVNDRWGKETRARHGGFLTTEYGDVGWGRQLASQRKWEECRGMGASFGYNRNETADDYASQGELVRLLVETVSRGGNLLLNIGPTADGRIPVIMEERLIQLGEWLSVHGEAIYDTTPLPAAAAEQGGGLWLTQGVTARGQAVFALVDTDLRHSPGQPLVISSLAPGSDLPKVRLLGRQAPLPCRWQRGQLHIQLPRSLPQSARQSGVCGLAISGVHAPA